MKLLELHYCFSDATRLRLLHLLTHGPLCVCHFQAIMDEPQVKISKHLALLRKYGLVTTRRNGNWIIYRLPDHPSPALAAHLNILQTEAPRSASLQKDRRRMTSVLHQNGHCLTFAARKRKRKPGL